MKKMRAVLNKILEDELSPGEALRGLRVEAGIPQEMLAELTGLARSNISALENGRLEMTLHYANLLAAALKVHPADLLFPHGKYKKTAEMVKIEKRAENILKDKRA